MSASKSAWWISVAVVFCLAGLTVPAGVAEVIGAAGEPADAGRGHDRPLEPPEAPGFIERLPLTNPNISTMSPTPASALSIRDGYWLASGNDMYKLSPQGNVLAHKVYPYHYYSSLLFISAMAQWNEVSIYALVSNTNATFLPSAMVRMNGAGEVEGHWNLDAFMASNSTILANDNYIAFLDSVPAYYLILIDTDFQNARKIAHTKALTLAMDDDEKIWVGTTGQDRYSIESQILRLDTDKLSWEGIVFRPLVEEDRPEHHGYIQEVVPLPGGGWVVAGLMGYFKESNPWDLRWKYYSYLAEIGADGTVVWAQLFEDLNLVGLKRDAAGGLWGFGNALINGNGIEAQLVIRFTTTGEPLWAVERRETYYFDDIRSGETAVTPEGGLALAWTTQFYKELWFGVLDPSRPLEGCDTFRSFDLTGRWLGPVTIETRPAEVQAVELDPVAIWEEPIELWEGEGEIIEWCPLRPLTRRGVRLSPLIR